ncbi:MAG TPA: NTP transferase domain-containing protein, partial [Kofleriaceae bacterium]|nr:NTP transferase domain-containing protein [Kofleriaceae bacterium]
MSGGGAGARAPGAGGAAGAIGAVILAAGAGRRLGGVAKALLPRAGNHDTRGAAGATYLSAIAATARAVGLADAVVVVGPPFGDAVAAHARALGLRVAGNPAPERGMASSIAAGFAAIAGGPAQAAWLWPVDHPAVTCATLRRLIAAAAMGAVRQIDGARPRYRGAGGHPPLIRSAVWPALAACADAADGARGVLRAARIVEVE